MRPALLLPLMLLCACPPQPEAYCADEVDDDGDGLVDCNDPDCAGDAACAEDDTAGDDDTAGEDADGDGYPAGEDCDDGDAAVNPGMAEVCDGVDQDCDGTADEDATDPSTWYSDADGDGYGDAAVTAVACAQPSGHVAEATDCDDTDAAVNPGVAETWYDGVDQDCSGGSDYDQDGDGFPAESYGGGDCDDEDVGLSPFDGDGDGFSTCTGDCDDGDTSDFPGAIGNHEGLTMTCLGRGTFTMGSPPDEVGRSDNETQYEVMLTGAFWLGVYEVSQAEFALFMGYDDPSTYAGCDDCAVTNVTWHQAAAFANTVSDSAELEHCYTCLGSGGGVVCELATDTPYVCEGYRLPTEAEWESAARAGTSAAFSSGGNLVAGTEDQCTTAVTLDNGEPLGDIGLYCAIDTGHAEEVGSRAANPWGLHDMHGNVWEWCGDWWDGSDYSGPVTDPWGNPTSSYRVLRGGSWDNLSADLRSARREGDQPGDSYAHIGFRLARTR